MKDMTIISHLTTRRAAVPPAQPGLATFAILAGGMAMMFSTMSLTPARAQSQVPDFGGGWVKDNYSYPKPYTAPGRAGGIANGYNNEYLKPWVVELLDRDDVVARSGKPLQTAHSLCYPEGVPYVFGEIQMQILQGPSEITLLYGGEQAASRTIYLNRPHTPHLAPSWFGESVGHFEGDSLVVDTIGLAAHPQAGSMGFFGTPHTDALHVVERYRFLKDGEKTVAPPLRDNRFRTPPYDRNDLIAGGKTLRLVFTVDDPAAYRKPWSVTLDYMPLISHIPEYVCAENYREKDLLPLVPRAEIPDF
jgi:hypothetical protein